MRRFTFLLFVPLLLANLVVRSPTTPISAQCDGHRVAGVVFGVLEEESVAAGSRK